MTDYEALKKRFSSVILDGDVEYYRSHPEGIGDVVDAFLFLLEKRLREKPLNIADIGAGKGMFLKTLPFYLRSSQAKQNFKKSLRVNLDLFQWDHPENLILADAHKLPFRDNSLDAAILTNILQYVNAYELLRRLHSALKPGGLALVVGFPWIFKKRGWYEEIDPVKFFQQMGFEVLFSKGTAAILAANKGKTPQNFRGTAMNLVDFLRKEVSRHPELRKLWNDVKEFLRKKKITEQGRKFRITVDKHTAFIIEE